MSQNAANVAVLYMFMHSRLHYKCQQDNMRNVRIVKHDMCYKVTICDKSDGMIFESEEACAGHADQLVHIL